MRLLGMMLFFYLMALYASFPMETGIKNACQLLGGYCAFWKCRPPTRRIGNCSAFTICCKR
uniref:Beta-defensin-like domain-containing protein n=1 Tax=Corvus moneduloides TaxID=1196302 RepID=A0A8C3D425_CORMO